MPRINVFSCLYLIVLPLVVNGIGNITYRRLEQEVMCSVDASKQQAYTNYFNAMRNIYGNAIDETCLPVNMKCGWPHTQSKLPLYIIAIGLEGSGHHLWTSVMKEGVFEEGCVWVGKRTISLLF